MGRAMRSQEVISRDDLVQSYGGAVTEAVLWLRGVVKSWGSRSVLAGADLELGGGETVLLSGVNGAGKTTLLRIAAGMIRPDAGAIRLQNLDPIRQRERFQRRLGYLSAGNSGLYGRLRAEHHLRLVSDLALVPAEARREACQRAIELFDLRPTLGHRVDRLSMGQRQRLRLALAFVHRPDVVLLDEPTTSLDADGTSLLARALHEHRARGGCALVCAPTGLDLPLPLDRRLVLEAGTIRGTG